MAQAATKQPSFDEYAATLKYQLLAGETIAVDHKTHSFDDVLNFTWDDTGTLTKIEEGLLLIAQGSFIEGAEVIHATIAGTETETGTAGKFVDALLGVNQ